MPVFHNLRNVLDAYRFEIQRRLQGGSPSDAPQRITEPALGPLTQPSSQGVLVPFRTPQQPPITLDSTQQAAIRRLATVASILYLIEHLGTTFVMTGEVLDQMLRTATIEDAENSMFRASEIAGSIGGVLSAFEAIKEFKNEFAFFRKYPDLRTASSNLRLVFLLISALLFISVTTFRILGLTAPNILGRRWHDEDDSSDVENTYVSDIALLVSRFALITFLMATVFKNTLSQAKKDNPWRISALAALQKSSVALYGEPGQHIPQNPFQDTNFFIHILDPDNGTAPLLAGIWAHKYFTSHSESSMEEYIFLFVTVLLAGSDLILESPHNVLDPNGIAVSKLVMSGVSFVSWLFLFISRRIQKLRLRNKFLAVEMIINELETVAVAGPQVTANQPIRFGFTLERIQFLKRVLEITRTSRYWSSSDNLMKIMITILLVKNFEKLERSLREYSGLSDVRSFPSVPPASFTPIIRASRHTPPFSRATTFDPTRPRSIVAQGTPQEPTMLKLRTDLNAACAERERILTDLFSRIPRLQLSERFLTHPQGQPLLEQRQTDYNAWLASPDLQTLNTLREQNPAHSGSVLNAQEQLRIANDAYETAQAAFNLAATPTDPLLQQALTDAITHRRNAQRTYDDRIKTMNQLVARERQVVERLEQARASVNPLIVAAHTARQNVMQSEIFTPLSSASAPDAPGSDNAIQFLLNDITCSLGAGLEEINIQILTLIYIVIVSKPLTSPDNIFSDTSEQFVELRRIAQLPPTYGTVVGNTLSDEQLKACSVWAYKHINRS